MATEGSAGIKVKHDWYQTSEYVVVTILARQLNEKDVNVSVQSSSLHVKAKLASGDDYNLELRLCHPVDVQLSSHKLLPSKLEVKLRKTEAHHWSSLEGSGCLPNARVVPSVAPPMAPSYPSSAKSARDWDAIANQIKRDEENEEPQGEEAVNKLFQKIYSDGSDEVKKAMVKSFTESGGTVLSTNWNDIGSKKTEIKPPDGMEYRKWD